MLPSLLFGFLFVLESPFTKPRELHPLRKTDFSEKTALLENKIRLWPTDILPYFALNHPDASFRPFVSKILSVSRDSGRSESTLFKLKI